MSLFDSKFDLFLKVTLSFITMLAICLSQWYRDRFSREPIVDLRSRKIILLLIIQTIYLVPYRTLAFCWGYELPFILVGQLVTWLFYYIFAMYVLRRTWSLEWAFWTSRFGIIFMVLGVLRTLETENYSSKKIKI